MADQNKITQLDKFAEKEIQELSPLMAKSLELKSEADKVVITTKDGYAEAKAKKRELVSHRTNVRDLRLTFTRKLDHVKSLFIGKQDEVLAPVIEAENLLKTKIGEWEDEQQRLKEAEEARIQAILDKLTVPAMERKAVTRDEVLRAQAALKMELSLLDQKDRNKKAVKDHVAEERKKIEELLEFVDERDRQAAEAQAQAEERAKLDADKKEFEEKKAAEKSNTDTNVATKNEDTTDLGDLAPGVGSAADREPSQGEQSSELAAALGGGCFNEADRVLKSKLDEIKEQELSEEQYAEWRLETLDAIYQVIAKHQ